MIHIYNHMMLTIRQHMENSHMAQPASLGQAIDVAIALEKQQPQADSPAIDRVAEYIRQDAKDAAEYLVENSHDFSNWLRMDIDTLEQKIVHLFLSTAEDARRELAQLSAPYTCTKIDYTHRIGTTKSLVCLNCHSRVHTSDSEGISLCPICRHHWLKPVKSRTGHYGQGN